MNVMHVDMLDDHLRRPLPKKHAPHHIDDYAYHHMRSAAFWNLRPMHLDQIWFCKEQSRKAWTEAANCTWGESEGSDRLEMPF